MARDELSIDELLRLAYVLQQKAYKVIRPSRRKTNKANKLLCQRDIVYERIVVLEEEARVECKRLRVAAFESKSVDEKIVQVEWYDYRVCTNTGEEPLGEEFIDLFDTVLIPWARDNFGTVEKCVRERRAERLEEERKT